MLEQLKLLIREQPHWRNVKHLIISAGSLNWCLTSLFTNQPGTLFRVRLEAREETCAVVSCVNVFFFVFFFLFLAIYLMKRNILKEVEKEWRNAVSFH